MLILSWCWSSLRQLAAIVYPWRGDANETAPLLRWCLHLLLWTGLLAGLWYLNRWGSVEQALRSPWPMLHRAWLPLGALLVYVLGWLGRGLWLALTRDTLSDVSPELDAAWSEACSALEQANVDIRATPVFLVLGPLTGDVLALLQSLGASSMSRRTNGPFQVFAQREAVFVACDQRAAPWASNPREEAATRLRRLCQFLDRDGGSKVALQGILLVVPFSALQADANLQSLVSETQDDLGVVRQTTGLEVPLYVAVSGLDSPAREGAGANGENFVAGWFQQFPPLPDLDPADVPTMFQGGIDWLCMERIAADVRGQFRTGVGSPVPAEEGKLTPALRDNLRLYQWLCAVQAWRTRLEKLLVEGTRNEHAEPGMVAGCYFLPQPSRARQEGITSPLPDGRGSVMQTLWGDLLTYQQTTTWTSEMIAAHAEQRRRTWQGYGLGLLGVGAILGTAGFLLWRL